MTKDIPIGAEQFAKQKLAKILAELMEDTGNEKEWLGDAEKLFIRMKEVGVL